MIILNQEVKMIRVGGGDMFSKTILINITVILSYFAFQNARLIHKNGDTKQAISIIVLSTLCIMIIVFDIYKP